MSKNDNLNVDIFCALKASEVSGVKPLILSNPGAGKSTTVYMFAKVRGYEVVLLRGNSTTPEEVMGYDVAPSDITYEKSKAAVHLRPSWFEEILRYHDNGQKVLLFLDEITTANEFVQAALLHLIFERMVGRERLPEDTLIVAAGNYAGNLSSTMALLPPIMNRFMLYNIAPSADDLDVFLNKYDGAIADPEGKCTNYLEELSGILKAIDNQERKVSDGMRNKIGEYIERAIKDTTRMLINSTKDLDLSITDLKNIYSDSDTDTVYGFVSLRTLNYLRDLTVAWYLCFGKSGISSENFRKAVDGLCGIGVSRKRGDTEVKINRVGKTYFDALVLVSNELEKLDNDRLPEYTKFFTDMLSKKGGFANAAEINVLVNKLKEMKRDEEIKNIDRPIDEEVVRNMCKAAEAAAKKLATVGPIQKDVSVLKSISPETLTGSIVDYNTICDLVSTIISITSDKSKNYPETTAKITNETVEKIRAYEYKLRTTVKLLTLEDPAVGAMIPAVSEIS